METASGKGGAVRGDKEFRVPEPGSVHGAELELYGPVCKFRGLGCGRFLGGAGFQVALDRCGVIGRGLPFRKGNGPGGAGGETVPQAVAIVLPEKAGLSVHNGDGPLMAGSGAQAAAVAPGGIDADEFSLHALFRLLLTAGRGHQFFVEFIADALPGIFAPLDAALHVVVSYKAAALAGVVTSVVKVSMTPPQTGQVFSRRPGVLSRTEPGQPENTDICHTSFLDFSGGSIL